MTELVVTHVRILVFNRHGCLLLARRRNPVGGNCVWEPPGGAIDPGESPSTAAERELQEETGLNENISPNQWVQVHREYTWKGEERVREEIIYSAHVDDPDVNPQMPTEEERATFLEWRWVSTDEISLLDDSIYPNDPFALAEAIEQSDR